MGVPRGVERPRACRPKGVTRPHPAPRLMAHLSPFTLQTRVQKHEARLLRQIRVDGPSAQRPAPAWGPPLACPALLLAHVWAVSAGQSQPALGAGKLLAPSPPPGLGGWLGQGEVSWNGTPGLAHPSPLGAPLDSRE